MLVLVTLDRWTTHNDLLYNRPELWGNSSKLDQLNKMLKIVNSVSVMLPVRLTTCLENWICWGI